MTEIATLPGLPKIKQAVFTRQRLFILTEKGDVYVIKIVEHFPKIEEDDHFAFKGNQ